MKYGDFVWCDLSAHNAGQSQEFYSQVFGWAFDGSDGYRTTSADGQSVAGHYQMPQKFIDFGMPAFWMSYIAVDDAAATTVLAKQLGAKVELGPAPFEGGGTFALIRDPLGAGFTVFQGAELGQLSKTAGQRLGHGLFVSDAKAVIPFYEELFGWVFAQAEQGVYQVSTSTGYKFYLHEIPDPAVRGKEQFWAVYFGVHSVVETVAKAVDAGGRLVAKMDLPEGPAALIHDLDGGAFVIVEVEQATKLRSHIPWKAWTGLILTLGLVFTNLLWPWAIFFAAWTIEGLRSGETYLFEKVARAENRALFWILIVLYSVLAFLCLPIWGLFRP